MHLRLLMVAGLSGLAALLFAFFSIGQVIEELVRRGIDEKLDTQVEILAHALMPSGRLDMSKVAQLPEFGSEPGWGWEIQTPAGEWGIGSKLDPASLRVFGRHAQNNAILAGHARTVDGKPLYLREMRHPGTTGDIVIIASSPAQVVDQPITEALGPIMVSLGFLGLGLVAATAMQLRYGLRPLRSVQSEIEKVRLGEREYLSLNQPSEIRPLAEEINALISQNAAGLKHARRHLSNLAHGLKTPLATLSLRLARDGSAGSQALLEELDKRIAHHLGRARSAALSHGNRSFTPVAPVVADLIAALQRIHADREVSFEQDLDQDIAVATDRQDFEEILGNLIDNAARFARSTVKVTARAEAKLVHVSIEDDGPGMQPNDIAEALQPGSRLDESEVGYGFGLSIAHELIELYGGVLALDRSGVSGGLSAVVVLPGKRASIPGD